MCYGTTCSNCQKKSWNGCGSHIPSVMDSLPKDQWCTCGPKVNVDGKEYPPKNAGTSLLGSVMGMFGGGKKDDGKKGEL